MIETAADRAALFNPAEFGVRATVAGRAVAGLFAHDTVDALDTLGTRPVLCVRTDDVPTVARGDAVSVTDGTATTSYTVGEVRPDGEGMTVLVLVAA